ncbi:hypothetical protein [Roseisolibacter agri]|uniref:BIG2 domain-containing protein n=1 Tax=Roseisolibacter agri TaxID=2014610 RepID=A0AA37VEX0_9BACT|nr:hypothetical protein [Roseisolibacter agri]GLC25919.1 hypothetical protein rosag_24320 [Roseisolibacter agri]
MTPVARVLLCLVGAAALASCHLAYVDGAPPAVARVVATPATATLSVGDSVLVQAVALDDDGRAITRRQRLPRWSSGDTTVVRLASVAVPNLDVGVSAARAHAVRAGTVVLRAESGGQRDSIVVTVR